MTYATIEVGSPPEHRGGNPDSPDKPRRFAVQSCNLSWAWGSEPATAVLVYVTNKTPVTTGHPLRIDAAGHTFHGVCIYDQPRLSSSGFEREIKFLDNRHFLDWSRVYCSFNTPDDTIEAGVRIRRYRHVLPVDWDSGKQTCTSNPKTAREIILLLLNSPTVGDDWTCDFHPDQDLQVPSQFDFNGVSLQSALQSVSDAQGLLFTLMGGPFNLVWARKGVGPNPVIPAASDDRASGLSLSGNPTRIRVIGDRNLYQIHDIPLVPDWPSAWEAFYDEILFLEYVYKYATITEPLTLTNANGSHTFDVGTTYKAIGAYNLGGAAIDPEQIVARQMAKAAALTMTVGEFALLAGSQYADHRKFSQRSRMDMPAVLYIRQILFRAFAFEDGFTIRNAAGKLVPIESLDIAQKMVAKVTHDPLTGRMDWDTENSPDGVGYAIIRGYQVGSDLFRTIRPERFNLADWNQSQDVWEHIEFVIDDSGQGDRYVLFDAPIIRSSDIVEMIDGYAVFKAAPTFTIPQVRVAVTFEAEIFSHYVGTGTRDDVEQVNGLHEEYAGRHGENGLETVPYDDGLSATEKAEEFGRPLLSRQFRYTKGSFVRWVTPDANGKFSQGTQLTGKIDRVTLEISEQGVSERVDLTTELPRQTFVPERDLDRGARTKALLPGQAQLRHDANIARLTSAAIRQSPSSRKLLSSAVQQSIGSASGTATVSIPVAPAVANTTLPAGSILRKKPTKVVSGVATNTQSVIPTDATADHSEFVGVTTRNGEVVGQEGREVICQQVGDILVRVKGPVKAGDVVGLVSNQNHLASDSSQNVGKAMQDITASEVKLIKVRTSSASAASGGFPFELVKVGTDSVRVTTGWLMSGLDAKAKVPITGLNETFLVGSVNDVFYLEVLFDKNGVPFMANVAKGTGWDSDVFPKLTRSIRASDDPRIGLGWVKVATGSVAAAQAKFAAFDTKRRHWKTYLQIGYCVPGSGDGFQISATGNPATVIQCLKTNLMLAEFCEAGIPVKAAIPYPQAIVEKLPLIVSVAPGFTGIQIVSDGFPDALIYYTIDGSTPTTASTPYGGEFAVPPSGTTIQAIAVLDGYYPGRAEFTVS